MITYGFDFFFFWKVMIKGTSKNDISSKLRRSDPVLTVKVIDNKCIFNNG